MFFIFSLSIYGSTIHRVEGKLTVTGENWYIKPCSFEITNTRFLHHSEFDNFKEGTFKSLAVDLRKEIDRNHTVAMNQSQTHQQNLNLQSQQIQQVSKRVDTLEATQKTASTEITRLSWKTEQYKQDEEKRIQALEEKNKSLQSALDNQATSNNRIQQNINSQIKTLVDSLNNHLIIQDQTLQKTLEMQDREHIKNMEEQDWQNIQDKFVQQREIKEYQLALNTKEQELQRFMTRERDEVLVLKTNLDTQAKEDKRILSEDLKRHIKEIKENMDEKDRERQKEFNNQKEELKIAAQSLEESFQRYTNHIGEKFNKVLERYNRLEGKFQMLERIALGVPTSIGSLSRRSSQSSMLSFEQVPGMTDEVGTSSS